jgi:hypothetical protein
MERRQEEKDVKQQKARTIMAIPIPPSACDSRRLLPMTLIFSILDSLFLVALHRDDQVPLVPCSGGEL